MSTRGHPTAEGLLLCRTGSPLLQVEQGSRSPDQRDGVAFSGHAFATPEKTKGLHFRASLCSFSGSDF
jgi:hypothetical protein